VEKIKYIYMELLVESGHSSAACVEDDLTKYINFYTFFTVHLYIYIYITNIKSPTYNKYQPVVHSTPQHTPTQVNHSHKNRRFRPAQQNTHIKSIYNCNTHVNILTYRFTTVKCLRTIAHRNVLNSGLYTGVN
jgi:hypothetical protein